MRQLCSLVIILFSLFVISCEKSTLLLVDSQISMIAGDEFSFIKGSQIIVLEHPQELSDLLTTNIEKYDSIIISAPFSSEQERILEKWPEADLYQIGSISLENISIYNFIPDRTAGYISIAKEVNLKISDGNVLFVESSQRTDEYNIFKEEFLKFNDMDQLTYIKHENFREIISELDNWDDIDIVVIAGNYNYNDIKWIVESEKFIFVEELDNWETKEVKLYSLNSDWKTLFKEINKTIKNNKKDSENSRFFLIPSKLSNFR